MNDDDKLRYMCVSDSLSKDNFRWLEYALQGAERDGVAYLHIGKRAGSNALKVSAYTASELREIVDADLNPVCYENPNWQDDSMPASEVVKIENPKRGEA